MRAVPLTLLQALFLLIYVPDLGGFRVSSS
uniref:Uncharacterized protein n=1 Tax=Anguilla anguilla TaxID=7936 RepID=A0A0E9SXD1_ANGAN